MTTQNLTQELIEITKSLSDLVNPKQKQNPQELLRLLLKRNQLLMQGLDIPAAAEENYTYRNSCEYLTDKTDIPYKFRAYHAGPAGQRRLVRRAPSFEGHALDDHLFFSLSPEEITGDYILPKPRSGRGIYVTDVRNLEGARIQTHYHSALLHNDELGTLISCYEDSDFMNKLLTTDRCWTTRFIEPFEGKPKEELRQEIIRKINGWLTHNTIPFDWMHLKKYRQRGHTFVLVPSPVEVSYP
jgi:hypothetical protein